jgi:hypothetical protein
MTESRLSTNKANSLTHLPELSDGSTRSDNDHQQGLSDGENYYVGNSPLEHR